MTDKCQECGAPARYVIYGLGWCTQHRGLAERHRPSCTCMTEDPGDGYGERVVIHSLACPQHPEHEEA